MVCHVIHDPVTQQVKVWWIERNPQGTFVYRNWLDDYEKVEDPGDEIAPSLTLPLDMFEALIGSSQGLIPATDATTKHLHDAIEVRDRLLTLIEHDHCEV